ncbi:MAG: hypothetical protein IJ820_03935 [Lachnospiraceae bacterium]|nr:hypothetical protein [Lachnospiraceae bacterium]
MSTGISGKKTKKKHPVKGDYGYYSYEKKRRIAIVAFLFGICLLIFFTGLIMTGTRKNLLTLVAILGVLPAAKWATSMIMILLQKPVDRNVYEVTEQIAGELTHGYELCVTAYEGRLSLDAVVVCGNSIAAYSSAEKGRFEFMETHIRKILHGNGLGNPAFKIFRRFDQYKERISQLASDPDRYREGLKYVPDEQHEGETRDEAVLRIIKAVSI